MINPEKTPRAMGGHQSAAALTTTWLTPPHVIEALGGWQSFDLDPCAAPAGQPWATAREEIREADRDGLSVDWGGRTWLNPPYTTAQAWLDRLALHGNGSALIFARTETDTFFSQIWERASGLLFIRGRLHFHRAGATRHPDYCAACGHDWYEYAPKAFACRHCEVAKANAGAPSVLCAYGPEEMDRLAAASLDGSFVPLRFARFAVIAGLDVSWARAVRDWVARQPGPVSVSDAYRYFAQHPKARVNGNWKAKVRQKLRQVAHPIERDSYVPRELAA